MLRAVSSLLVAGSARSAASSSVRPLCGSTLALVARMSTAEQAKFDNILVERRGAVGVIFLNRPKSLNALCDALIRDVNNALDDFGKDNEIGAVVITGSGTKAFAAGADISEVSSFSPPPFPRPSSCLAPFVLTADGSIHVAQLAQRDFMTMYKSNQFEEWDAISKFRKPLIAAVNGFALGGGCELAMSCDIILASETASFGQPEIAIGTVCGSRCQNDQRASSHTLTLI